jgi:Holliday junction DNA helicase RuvB
VRDFADVIANGEITKEVSQIALDRLEIDSLGLDSLDKRYLTMLIKGYNGGPAGIETLASSIGEESITLVEVCEPYLMQLGFISRTKNGRCATRLAYQHLGFAPNGDINQLTLD